MSKRYVGPGRVRPCLAWRIDAPDGSVHYRGTRAQARTVLQRIRDGLEFLAKERAKANAVAKPDELTAATRRMLGMAPATDTEAMQAEADNDGDQ